MEVEEEEVAMMEVAMMEVEEEEVVMVAEVEEVAAVTEEAKPS